MIRLAADRIIPSAFDPAAAAAEDAALQATLEGTPRTIQDPPLGARRPEDDVPPAPDDPAKHEPPPEDDEPDEEPEPSAP